MAKYVIVGGVAGGATTAARLRRMDEKAEIILFERGNHISYANCGLPYFLGGKIINRDKLFVQNPERMQESLNIDVRVKSEIVAVNRKKKTVLVRRLGSGGAVEEYKEHYDKLVLSPGAKPVRPPIAGVDTPGIYTLRNMNDVDNIYQAIGSESVRRIVIVGAGYIGLEMAENMHKRGLSVTIVELTDHVINSLDYDMAAEIHHHLKTKGIELYLNDGVASFNKTNGSITVLLESGTVLAADVVMLSVGVRPDTRLAEEAGITIGETGGIAVNSHMQTSDPDIYALGDAAEVEHPVIGRKVLIPLAGPANKQGRIVADNIVSGNKRRYSGSIGTAIAKVFDLTVAATGLSENILKRENIPYIASITHSSSHAGYYPDARPLSFKILFSPDRGTFYGAQIVGYDGVDKRIDVIAAILKNRGSVYDLMEIEHAYAPPFSSAKDPVNIAGFVADNILNGVMQIIHWHELEELNKYQFLLLDVRTPLEFIQGTIPGAVNIPYTELRERMHELPKNKKIVVFCQVGQRAYVASRILKQNGFADIYNLSGGFKTYSYAIERPDTSRSFEEINV